MDFYIQFSIKEYMYRLLVYICILLLYFEVNT